MLQRITVHNLALISDLEIEFCGNLNVFTGETGAGKSIIVDSLMLLIGARYDKSMLKFGEDKGYVEGVFVTENSAPLDELGIECDDGMFIVTRKFFKDGRNEIRVNGKQITTAMLRDLMSSYVDIYGQNEYQSLLKTSEQKKILDYFVFGRDGKALADCAALFDEYKKTRSAMDKLGDTQARAQRIDILKYQIDEIESAAVKSGEEESLVERRHVLMSAERIKTALAEIVDGIDGDDGAAGQIGNAIHSAASIGSYGELYSAIEERLRSVAIELDDIADGVRDELDGMDGSENELDKVLARLDKIRALKNKYGPFDAMTAFLADAKEELVHAENGEEEYAALSEKERALSAKLYDACVRLSELRRDGAAKLASKILPELADLGMPNSKFEVVFSPMPERDGFLDKTTAVGFDEFEFYLSPNVGQPLKPLAKIISGGEMSRFMLALKLITGDLGNIGTMIFDEVDAGISGTVGQGVAKKLCRLSRARQVLCVTHLPQIAAMADSHFYIEKTDDGSETHTSVTALDRNGQIGEVARLSGTKGVSSTAMRNAEEIKDFCDEYKKSVV